MGRHDFTARQSSLLISAMRAHLGEGYINQCDTNKSSESNVLAVGSRLCEQLQGNLVEAQAEGVDKIDVLAKLCHRVLSVLTIPPVACNGTLGCTMVIVF